MKKIMLALLGAVAFSAAFADNNDVSTNPVYVDVNAGMMNSISSGASTSFATNLNVGYMFNKYWGVEGGGIYSPIRNASPDNYYSLDGAIKGVLPLSNIFDLYGKLGLAYNMFGVSWFGSPNNQQNSWGALIGVGAQFNINSQWALHLEDDYISQFSQPSGINNPNLVLAGVEFKF